ncbi:hypothetical protein [Amycolatopsis sp. BJA-103]|nr:hypothetical protein [Amycolatopsis sp. BJA-103]
MSRYRATRPLGDVGIVASRLRDLPPVIQPASVRLRAGPAAV